MCPVATVIFTGLVTAVADTGLATLQEKFMSQELVPDAMLQEAAAGVSVPVIPTVHLFPSQIFPDAQEALMVAEAKLAPLW